MTEETETVTKAWFPAAPAPIAPVPVGTRRQLRGERVIVGDAQHGWRVDLRADDVIERDGSRLVPVLDEAAYYRSELDQVEALAKLVPVEQVWIEQVAEAEEPADPSTGQPHDLLDRLVSLNAPPPRRPVPARDEPRLTGRRVVVVAPTTARRDLRATTELYQRADATICVRVCPEPDWYRWGLTGQPPSSTAVPIYLVWVE